MTVVHYIARPLLAAIFIEGARGTLKNANGAAAKAEPMIEKIRSVAPALPADGASVVRINAAAQLIGGLMLASGKFPRISALILAGSLVPTTLAGHDFWNAPPETRSMQRLQFAKNLSILGGLLFAATDRRGKPSVSWRLQHIDKPDWIPGV